MPRKRRLTYTQVHEISALMNQIEFEEIDSPIAIRYLAHRKIAVRHGIVYLPTPDYQLNLYERKCIDFLRSIDL